MREILDPDEAFLEHRPWVAEHQSRRSSSDHETDIDNAAEEEAKRMMRRGALQVTASMLVDQLTQQNRGEEEVSKGVRLLQAVRERQRARRDARMKGSTGRQRSRKPKP